MKLLSLTILLFFITGCSMAIEGKKYLSSQVTFKPKEFFNGDIKAWGIVQDRKGNITQQFTVDIVGKVDGNQIVLDETFDYLAGEGVIQRTWTITVDPQEEEFLGKANDVDSATGQIFGNAMHWAYSMDIPYKGDTIEVAFEDWMWAFDSDHLINRSYIKKFGFVVAEVTLFMQKI